MYMNIVVEHVMHIKVALSFPINKLYKKIFYGTSIYIL